MEAGSKEGLLEFCFRSELTEIGELGGTPLRCVEGGRFWEGGLRLGKRLYLRARSASFTRFSRLSSFTLKGERCASASSGDMPLHTHQSSSTPPAGHLCLWPPAYSSSSPPSGSTLPSMPFLGHDVSFRKAVQGMGRLGQLPGWTSLHS